MLGILFLYCAFLRRTENQIGFVKNRRRRFRNNVTRFCSGYVRNVANRDDSFVSVNTNGNRLF